MRESSAVACDPLLSPVLCHSSQGSETFPSAKLLRVGAGKAVPTSVLMVVQLGFWF